MQDKLENINWLNDSFNESSNTFNLPSKKNIGQKAIANSVAEFLTSHSSITTLDFSSNKINIQAIHILSLAFKAPSLTSIDLSENKMTDETLKELSTLFDNNQTLLELNLVGNQITSEGIATLWHAFRNNSALQLKISHNPIGSEAAKILSVDLNHKAIGQLFLEKNKIDDLGIADLSESLQTHFTITKLSLSGNCIGEKAAEGLRLVLEKNKHIQFMDLSGNKMGSAEVTTLSLGLMVNWGIEILDLSFNPKMRLSGIQAVTKALKHHPTLCNFYFMGNQLQDEGTKSISDLLIHNTKITSLNVSGNNMKASGGQSIASALEQNKSIQKLDISSNPIGNEGIISLANVIQNHVSIQYLFLKSTAIAVKGALILASALEKNKTLKHCELDIIDSDANKIEACAKAFIDILEKNPRLTGFELRSKLLSQETKDKIKTCIQRNLQSVQKEQADQFVQIMLVLARNSINPNFSVWASLPPEVRSTILHFFCLSLSHDVEVGKSYDQLSGYQGSVFTNIHAINQAIDEKKSFKIVEKIPTVGKSTFLFFQPSIECPLTDCHVSEDRLKPSFQQ